MSASSHDEEKRPVNTAAATENDTHPTEAAQPTDADEKGKSKTTVSVADNWHPPKKTRLKSGFFIC